MCKQLWDNNTLNFIFIFLSLKPNKLGFGQSNNILLTWVKEELNLSCESGFKQMEHRKLDIFRDEKESARLQV